MFAVSRLVRYGSHGALKQFEAYTPVFPSFTSLLGLCCTRRFSSASRQADKVARCHKAQLKVPLIFCVAKATGHMNVYCTALEPFIVHGRTHRAESKNGSEQ